ncbi:DNA polymerase domain-containing protein (plasmid) [Deinococcus radiomollis]|uniref:3'-5' exonuclease n=1 Tax=Deinococcus radiomollis TaxID=468916 RepID=UPI00389227C7
MPTSPDQLDPLLFGHDPTTGIVSVHADHLGRAWIWKREDGNVTLERGAFRPWIFARDLQDVEHLGSRLVWNDDSAEFSVRSLKGEEGTLRYLLTGRDGQALRQEVLRGASKRKGRRIGSLREVSGYYGVGTAEQYLMVTGRTYFKGLEMQDTVRLQFDLETTSLSPDTGRMFMIAVKDNRGFERILEARKASQEGEMIESLMEVIAERDPDIIENHNISSFDLPFLVRRAEHLGVRVNFSRPEAPSGLWKVQDGGSSPHWACAGREIVDTIDAVRRLNLPSAGLKAVSQLFGIAPEGRVYLEGAKIAETYATQPALVRTYALQDVEEVEALSRRVLAPSFALARMAPRPYHRLPYAGTAMGMLEPMMIRAYLHAGVALPGTQAPGEAQQGGSVTLFAEGVLKRVVKADVASMYPSLIRHERIGPRSDTLGVFLHLMDHLTGLRLEHKAAARRGDPGEHDAMQSAMKLVINSAYGYTGAGRMSVFGDVEAANTVTRRGRETLREVTDALASRGVTLIEADTDGVYFSVPERWTAHDEKRVIGEVDALLPAGITLEFDGRWAAMLSHETKNYALLGYDGTLELKGAAFTSSRGERYGRVFLEDALKCLLEGAIERIPVLYRETVRRLHACGYTDAEVSSRVKVNKSQDEYALTRASRQEAVYEALIRSGRAWKSGERFTLYQRAGVGLSVLDDPEGCSYDAPFYAQQLLSGYASRLKKGLAPADFQQLFAQQQAGLFDAPLSEINAVWRVVADWRQ